jgi:hypothetical protein
MDDPDNRLPPAGQGFICAMTARQWRRALSPLYYDDLKMEIRQDHATPPDRKSPAKGS